MKIVINTIPLLSPLMGIGKYTYQIARSLKVMDNKNEYSFFYGYYTNKILFVSEKKAHFFNSRERLRKIPLLRSVPRKLTNTVNYFYKKKFDIYFEPNFIPVSIPAKRTVATICDFSFVRCPEWHPIERIQHFQKFFWEKIKRVDRIIFISDFIKNEAINQYGFPPEKLVTIYLGFDPRIFRIYQVEELNIAKKQYGLPENFILFAGSIEPRKNLITLIRSYVQLEDSVRNEYKLVFVGSKGWENEEVLSLLKKFKKEIIFMGYVPEKDLGKFYNLASVFVYPTFYEGFGLPLLEAMACGCPVIASHSASLPEIGGDAAYYVDPQDVNSISQGINLVLKEGEIMERMKAKGLDRAKLFSWEKSARDHLAVFREVSSM